MYPIELPVPGSELDVEHIVISTNTNRLLI